MNSTAEGHLLVHCNENFDGGLPQSFLMEMWKTNDIHPAYNITVQHGPPIFRLSGIDLSLEYEIRLYAINQKGRSEAVKLRTSPLKGVAMYTSKKYSIHFKQTFDMRTFFSIMCF